ncbi:TetR/AcrR family transcriptional regulator [Herbidospora daliensis]|uniref:TetR/AcrR family transcriptional regulator n=1 Tax=Herbidospora daliensis TaxID=295585 RepID=UPI000784F999|nr:TetR/AcrR family transcriptional regulator [Herbidospora daliensis]
MKAAPLTVASIVEAAADLADTTGFDSVTLSAVARRLGVRSPSLYSHVKDRDALLEGVTVLALTELASRVSVAVAGRAGRSALEALADAHRDYARESPGRWEALQRPAGEEAARSAGARDIVALTAAVLRGYPLPESEHVHAVRFIGSTINGYLSIERNGGFSHSLPSAAVSWHRIIGALDAALRAWPAPPEGEQP